MKKLYWVLALSIFAAVLPGADLTAVRRSGAFTLDGKLDEVFWGKAPAFSAAHNINICFFVFFFIYVFKADHSARAPLSDSIG